MRGRENESDCGDSILREGEGKRNQTGSDGLRKLGPGHSESAGESKAMPLGVLNDSLLCPALTTSKLWADHISPAASH